MDLSERPTQGSSAQRRHPWELARFQFFRRVLTGTDVALPSRVLDVGAGDGWFARQLLDSLPAAAAVTCWDAHYDHHMLASFTAEGGPRVHFTRERPSGHFDLIMLLDVLEHVEHDAEFLAPLVRENLAPGGTVLVSVPAWQQLFTEHDTRLRHYRRYAPRAAAALIEQSGLTIVRRGGLFHGLLLPRTAAKARELIAPPAANGEPPALDWHGGPWVTRAVDWLLAADNQLSLLASRASVELPGLSWWALCKRP